MKSLVAYMQNKEICENRNGKKKKKANIKDN